MLKGSRNECYGVIAQLGERLNGIQEVSGSIPLSSTNSEAGFKCRLFSCSDFCFDRQREFSYNIPRNNHYFKYYEFKFSNMFGCQ